MSVSCLELKEDCWEEIKKSPCIPKAFPRVKLYVLLVSIAFVQIKLWNKIKILIKPWAYS